MNRQTFNPTRGSVPGTRRACCASSLVAAVCAAGSAHAQTSPYYFRIGQIVAYDSNLFRVDSGEESAWISTTGLRAGFDQPIGRQRVFGSAGLGYTAYRNFSDLNTPIYDVDLGLAWEAASRLSGSVVTRATQRQASFADYGSLAADNSGSNRERTQAIDLRAQYGGASIWTLEALGRLLQCQLLSQRLCRPREQLLHVGRRRALPAGGSLVLWPDRPQDRRRVSQLRDRSERQHGRRTTTAPISICWRSISQPAPAASLARLSYSDENHDQDPSRDFNGWTGEVRWDYQATGKLLLGTNFTRVTGSGSSYSVGPSTGGGTPGVPVQSTCHKAA